VRQKGDQPEIEGRFGLRLFARSASVLSLNSMVSFARAVITAKLFAVTLGPSVVGILAQLLNFSAFVSVIIPLGLTTGVAKMVAENRQAPREVSRIVSTASTLAFASALGMAIVLAPVAGKISESLTGTSQYGLLVLLIVASFPLYNLAGVLSYVLQGLAEVQRLTRANIITAALSVLLLVPLTIAYGLTGAMVAVLATSFVQAGVFSWMLLRTYAARAWSFANVRFDRPTARDAPRIRWHRTHRRGRVVGLGTCGKNADAACARRIIKRSLPGGLRPLNAIHDHVHDLDVRLCLSTRRLRTSPR